MLHFIAVRIFSYVCRVLLPSLFMTYLELFEVLNIPESEMPYIPKTTASSSANTENLLQFSIPEGKLFYPEPFIASPSYIHTDLPYLHIFQY